MKLVIASDIHGAADWCQKLVDAVREEQPDRVVLLGDLLYHGPRNNLPADYEPKRVIEMLNGMAGKIIAVRGNCDAEVDQMVLEFPCMAGHNILVDPEADGKTLFFTHGHIYGPGLHNSVDAWPALAPNSALIYGHTHQKVLQQIEEHPGVTVFNPGSLGLPKDGSHSFGIYENGTFRHVELD